MITAKLPDGREFVSSDALVFGDYGGAGSVGRANIDHVLAWEGVRVVSLSFNDWNELCQAGVWKEYRLGSWHDVALPACDVVHLTGAHASETLWLWKGWSETADIVAALDEYPLLDDEAAAGTLAPAHVRASSVGTVTTDTLRRRAEAGDMTQLELRSAEDRRLYDAAERLARLTRAAWYAAEAGGAENDGVECGPWHHQEHSCAWWAKALAEGMVYVNTYTVERVYGGPEEGGWWYDAGSPVESVRAPLADAERVQVEREAANADLAGVRSRYSVIGGPDVMALVEGHFARPWPSRRPHYE